MGDDLLADEGSDGIDTGIDRKSAPGTADAAKRVYSAAAECALNRPIREFFPLRATSTIVAAAGALVAVGMLAALHVWARPLADRVDVVESSLFDLAAPGNVGNWFASLLMAWAGVTAAFVFSLRRHRVDDYHGRYRVWIWTTIGCLVASLVETSAIATPVRALSGQLATWLGARDEVVWPVALGTLLGIAYVRLLVEIWRCRTAAALLTLAALTFVATAATSHDWGVQVSELSRPLIVRGTWLAGYVLLLVTLLVYARYVTLEIEGRVAVRMAAPKPRKPKKQPKKQAKADDDEESDDEPPRKTSASVRTDLDADTVPASQIKTPQPAPQPTRSTANAASTGGDSQHANGHRHLSRKERRRLRREAQMEA